MTAAGLHMCVCAFLNILTDHVYRVSQELCFMRMQYPPFNNALCTNHDQVCTHMAISTSPHSFRKNENILLKVSN